MPTGIIMFDWHLRAHAAELQNAMDNQHLMNSLWSIELQFQRRSTCKEISVKGCTPDVMAHPTQLAAQDRS